MIIIGSYARTKDTNLIVQAVSSPYTKENILYIDVRFVFDPLVTYTSKIEDLELVSELE
jgi:hypothetical protein